jgi:hypothetical protein
MSQGDLPYKECVLPCASIDQLVGVELRPWSRPKGYVRAYYEAAMKDKPISYEIAEDILKLKKAKAAIITGIYSEHFPVGEMDGPIGGIVMSRVLEMLGHDTFFLAEDQIKGPFEALKKRLQLKTTFVSTSGLNSEAVRKWAKDYDMAVTIEKLGRAADGHRHSIQGTPLSDPGDSYIDDFITELTQQGKLTIGIGDGGNEIGHGKIYDTVVKLHPQGKVIATVTATKHCFPVTVSNIGVYAICGALALQAKRPELLVDGETVKRLILTANTIGCLDGSTVNPHFIGDDGIPIDAVVRIVDLISDIVLQWGRTIVRNF